MGSIKEKRELKPQSADLIWGICKGFSDEIMFCLRSKNDSNSEFISAVESEIKQRVTCSELLF